MTGPWTERPTVPAGRWARRPLAGHGAWAGVPAGLNGCDRLVYSNFPEVNRFDMALCFYVLGAFLPSLPGWCRHTHPDPQIKTEPGG